jgi:putative polyketide hydroxylase
MTTQVLVVVVGGALTGLSGAVFLAAHDVRRVSSSNATPICYNTSWAVRGINPSTVELFRQVRLEPAIRGRRACEQRDRYAFAPRA